MEIQFQPSWTETWTEQEAEEQLEGFKFKGPGWYHHGKDTMLVIPKDRTPIRIWHSRTDEKEKFLFHCYSGFNPMEMFNLIVNAPVRE